MFFQPYGVSSFFLTLVWEFNQTRVLFEMGEGYTAIKRGEGCLEWGWGQSDYSQYWLCNYSKYNTTTSM
jgi:hypothetical protein